MRRFIAIVTILIVWLTAIPGSYAQSHYRSRLFAGVHGGVDVSRVFFTPSVRQKMAVGATAGVAFRYVEESHFGLQAEINLAQRGWSEDFYPNTALHYQRTINYIDIPVLAHIYFGRRGRFFANLGPQVNFCIGESISANFDINNISSVADFPAYRQTEQLLTPVERKVDYGICAGLGGEFSITPRNSISLEVRFYYGLGHIFSVSRTTTFRGANQMSVAATIGYMFRFK